MKIEDNLMEAVTAKLKERLKTVLRHKFKDDLEKVGVSGEQLENMLSQIADNIDDAEKIIKSFIDPKSFLVPEIMVEIELFFTQDEIHKKYSRYVISLWNREENAGLRVLFLQEKGFKEYVDQKARPGVATEKLFRFDTLPDEIKEVVNREFVEFATTKLNLAGLWNSASIDDRFNFIANILSGFSPEKRIVIAMYLSKFDWNSLKDKVFAVLSQLGRVRVADLDLTKESDWHKLLDNNKIEWSTLINRKAYLKAVQHFDAMRNKEELFDILKSMFDKIKLTELSSLIEKNKHRWVNMILFDILEEIPINLRVEFTKLALKGSKLKHHLSALKTTSDKDSEDIAKKAKERWRRLSSEDRLTILMKVEKRKTITILDKELLAKEEDLDKILEKVPEISYIDILTAKTKSEIDMGSKSAASTMWDNLDEVERLTVLMDIEKELKIEIKDKERLAKSSIEEVEKELGIGYLKLYSFAQRFRKSIWHKEFEKLVKEFNLSSKETVELIDVFKMLERKWPDRFNTVIFLVKLLLLSGVGVYYITDKVIEDLYKQVKARFGNIKSFINFIDKYKIDINLVKDMGVKQFVDYVYKHTLNIKDKVLGFIPDEFRKDTGFLKNLYKLRSLVDDDKIIEVFERAIVADELDKILLAIKKYDRSELSAYFCREILFAFDVPCERAQVLYNKIKDIRWGEIMVAYSDEARLVIADLVSRGLTDDEIIQWLKLYSDVEGLVEKYKEIIQDKVFTVLKEFGLYPLERVDISKIIDLWIEFKNYDKFIKKFEARLKSKVIKEEVEEIKWEEAGFTKDEIEFWTKVVKFTIADLETVKMWRDELVARGIKFDVAKKWLPVWINYFGRDLNLIFKYIDKYGVRNVTKAFIEEIIPEFAQQIDEIIKNKVTVERQFEELKEFLQTIKSEEFWDDLIKTKRAEYDWSSFVSVFDDYMSRIYHNAGFSIVRYIKTQAGIKIPYKGKAPPAKLSDDVKKVLEELNERIDKFIKFFYDVMGSYYNLVGEIEKLLKVGDRETLEKNKEDLVKIGEEISDTFYILYNAIIRRGEHILRLKLELEKVREVQV